MNGAKAAPLLTNVPEIAVLTAVSGPEKGASFRLVPPRVTLGRGPDNDIVLKDPKISREQAAIEIGTGGEITIRDLSGRGNIFVNGAAVTKTVLRNGDGIAVGGTNLTLRLVQRKAPQADAKKKSLQSPIRPSPGLAPASASASASAPAPKTALRSSAPGANQSGGRLPFYAIVLLLAGLVVYLLFFHAAKPKPKVAPRTTEEIEAAIQSSEERQELLFKSRHPDGALDSARVQEADQHFRQGFRDYQRGNYSRAMRSLETARAIDPGHERAKRYFQLSIRKRDEFIDRYIRQGRKYKEKNMYSRCVGSLDAALKALDDPANRQDVKIREAQALRKECDALAGERF